jgi:hypothetical protein
LSFVTFFAGAEACAFLAFALTSTSESLLSLLLLSLLLLSLLPFFRAMGFFMTFLVSSSLLEESDEDELLLEESDAIVLDGLVVKLNCSLEFVSSVEGWMIEAGLLL